MLLLNIVIIKKIWLIAKIVKRTFFRLFKKKFFFSYRKSSIYIKNIPQNNIFIRPAFLWFAHFVWSTSDLHRVLKLFSARISLQVMSQLNNSFQLAARQQALDEAKTQ